MENSAKKILKDTYEIIDLDVTKIVVLVMAFFYGSGYLIQAITLRNYGIHRLEAVKLQYIEVGVTFTVLTLLLTIVPVGCLLAHFRIRKKSGLPHFYLGATGYLLNTYNLFLVIVCFALFITRNEWHLYVVKLDSLGIHLRLYQALTAYAIIALFVLKIQN